LEFELREHETVAVKGKKEGSYLWKGAGRNRKKQRKEILDRKWFLSVPVDCPRKNI
jgi:hypothetical protein